jgi:drug/metabolite transporter (DMT)-like permease
MTAGKTSHVARGVVPLLAFAALSALVDVYTGNRLQKLSPLSVAAISFTLTAAFFLGGDILRRGAAAALRPLRTHRYDVIAINVSTAVTWISLLYALEYLEPAVVNVVGLAIGPVLTVALGPLLRRRSSVLATEIAVSVGICAFIAVLVWGSVSGHSGVGDVGQGRAVLGVVLTLVCGLGSTANVIYSKRLSEAGQSPRSVLAIRFFLMIAVAWAMVLTNGSPQLAAAFGPAAVIAVIGVALPLYLIQVGIKYTEPITASLITALSPPFAFLLQLRDRRLQPSAFTLVGLLGITALVAWGVVARGRKERRSPPLLTTLGTDLLAQEGVGS